MYNSSLTAIPYACLRILIGVVDAIHNQMVIHKNYFSKEMSQVSYHLAHFFEDTSFTSQIAQAIVAVIVHLYSADREV
jgi:hypothetical protein